MHGHCQTISYHYAVSLLKRYRLRTQATTLAINKEGQVMLDQRSIILSCLQKMIQLGYSRKNPHTPDGWHSGKSCGRGVQGPWKSRRKGG